MNEGDVPGPTETSRLLHDLRVHQVELEAQNDELRRAQTELDASRARYIELYDLAPVGYVTIDAAGRIQQANLTIATLLGTPREALVGQPFLTFIARGHRDDFYLLQKKLARTAAPQSCELQMLPHVGSFWAQLDVAAGQDATAPLRVVVSDVTARKVLELQHGHERRVLQSLTTGMPLREVLAELVLGFDALSPDMVGAVLLVDQGHLTNVTGPSFPASLARAIDDAARELRDPLAHDFKDLALQHGLYPCWSQPIMGAAGRVLGSFASYFRAPRDATAWERASLERSANLASVAIERAHVEATLRESEQRREVALAGADLGLWDWNVLTGAAILDARWCAMIGYREDEVAPTVEAWRTLIHPEDTVAVTTLLDAHLRGEIATYDAEFRLRHKAGHWLWVQARGKVVERDAAGAPRRMAGTHLDISTRKQADVTLREGAERTARLEKQLHNAAKIESVGRLAGGVAHDFNNMLAVIMAHVELALMEVGPSPSMHDDLVAIQAAAGRAAAVTSQLLAFARQQPIAPKVLHLNETVTSMLKLLLRILGEDIQINWQPSVRLWPIEIDPSQIDQILTNLCINARDAITGVGNITIRTENRVLDAAYCADGTECAPGDYVLLSVSDDGAGMSADVLAHIFEPFFTTKRVGEGTGLGLATVYGAVRQNRGHVTVASAAGQGTTFEIYLPRAVVVVEAAHVVAKAVTRGEGEVILVVEDEPMLLQVVARMLTNAGYVVLTASTPTDAMQIASSHDEIQLLVTDVIMPGTNGRELASSLQTLHPGLRCLFMSGYTADVISTRGLLERGVHFIQKPFSNADILASVRVALHADRT